LTKLLGKRETMMPDLISIDSVENLESHTLTSVLNALLTAESDYRNVSLIDLDLTLRTNDPDAGIILQKEQRIGEIIMNIRNLLKRHST
jgi:hypothetical protein